MTNSLPAYRWIKFLIGNLDDMAFMTLADATASIYIKLYLLAGRAAAEGALIDESKAFSIQDLAWKLRTDPVILSNAIDELIQSGFITREKNCFVVTRFIEEQGPSDNLKRQQWAEQQRRHRAKTSESKELNINLDIKEEEEEKSTRRQADVRLTKTTSSSEVLTFRDELIQQLGLKYPPPIEEARMDECLRFWTWLATKEGWPYDHLDAILELYAPGALEDRIRRENKKVEKANQANRFVGTYVAPYEQERTNPLAAYSPKFIQKANEHTRRMHEKSKLEGANSPDNTHQE